MGAAKVIASEAAMPPDPKVEVIASEAAMPPDPLPPSLLRLLPCLQRACTQGYRA